MSTRTEQPTDLETTSSVELWLTPVLLLAALAGLYYYLNGVELDDIEQRYLTADVIWRRVVEHVELVAVSSLIVIVSAVPLGVLLTRGDVKRTATPSRRKGFSGRWFVVGVANLGAAIPSIGVLVLLAITVGIGFKMAVVALVLVSFLPVLRNTMVGLSGVDRSLINAARGMGLTKTSVLFRVELPLAVPVMLAGIRVALILNVGSAALATYTNAGGLGTLIEVGIVLSRTPVLITGSVLTAVLALSVDWLAGLVERLLRPRGL